MERICHWRELKDMNAKKVIVIASAGAIMMAAAFGLAMKLKPDYEVKFVAGQEEYEVNGKVKAFDEKSEKLPYIDKDTEKLKLPLRYVIEELGGTMVWEDESKSAVIRYNSAQLEIVAGSKKANLNGYGIVLQNTPILVKGTLYVTADLFTDYLGTVISWDGEKKQITLRTETVVRPIVAVSVLSHEDEDAQYSVEIPVITGLNDRKFEESMNLFLADEEMDEIQDFILQAKRTHKPEDAQFYRYTTCTTTYRSPEWISILSQGQTLTGQGTEPLKTAMNIDLQGQRLVGLEDLFKNESYKKKLASHFEISEDIFTKETEKNFYITTDKELVFFVPNQVGGFTEHEIALKEMKRLLKPKYQYLS